MIATLGKGEKRLRADPAKLGMVPARESFHADQHAVGHAILWLEHESDLVPRHGPDQIGFKPRRTPTSRPVRAIGPEYAASGLLLYRAERLIQAVDHCRPGLARNSAQQRRSWNQVQHLAPHRQTARDAARQCFCQPLPALTTDSAVAG